MKYPRLSPTNVKGRAALGCALAAACLTVASTPASAADPALPSLPQVPKPPAVPQLPNVQPPSVQLPAPPSAPQVQVPRPPAPLPAPAPSLPGTTGGTDSTGRAAPGAPEAQPGQGTGGSNPYVTGGAGSANGTAAAGSGPAARRRANRRLQHSVRNLQGCLSAVDGLDRRVLVLRTGLGGRPAGSRRSVARRLGVSRRRVARAERSGLRSLRGAARGSGCESGPSPMAVDNTPWLMPLGSASTGLPLLSMASLAGDPRAEERGDGAVLGVTRSGAGDSMADGAESPGSTLGADEAERQPERVAASTGDGSELLLPMLLTIALLALLAGFVVSRNRRSPSAAAVETAPTVSATHAAPATSVRPEAEVAPWAAEDDPPDEETPEQEPAVVHPEPRVEDEPIPAAPAGPPASGSHKTRNTRIAASAAVLAAGGVIRALLRVRRRR